MTEKPKITSEGLETTLKLLELTERVHSIELEVREAESEYQLTTKYSPTSIGPGRKRVAPTPLTREEFFKRKFNRKEPQEYLHLYSEIEAYVESIENMGQQHQYRKLMGRLLISLGKIKGFYDNWIFQDHKFDEDYNEYNLSRLKRLYGDLASTGIAPIIF